jgi:hypothetical protein
MTGLKMRDTSLKRHGCQEAEVGRARSRMLSLWLDFFSLQMQIDFLISEVKAFRPSSKVTTCIPKTRE